MLLMVSCLILVIEEECLVIQVVQPVSRRNKIVKPSSRVSPKMLTQTNIISLVCQP